MKNKNLGFTLVEIIIYIALLSILLSGLIRYIFSIQMKNYELKNKINDAYDRQGFGALVAVLMLSTGMFAFVLVNFKAVEMYADFVNKKELRIQTSLNADSCLEYVILLLENDRFLSGGISIKEFGCTVNVSVLSFGSENMYKYKVVGVSELVGVKSYINEDVEISR